MKPILFRDLPDQEDQADQLVIVDTEEGADGKNSYVIALGANDVEYFFRKPNWRAAEEAGLIEYDDDGNACLDWKAFKTYENRISHIFLEEWSADKIQRPVVRKERVRA